MKQAQRWAAGALGFGAAVNVVSWLRSSTAPELYFNADSPLAQEILQQVPLLHQAYYPTIGCQNGHLATILGSYARSVPKLEYTRERFDLGDGAVFVDWIQRCEDPLGVLIILPVCSQRVARIQ
jgi:hypothetical protein